jgi:hypothetical protein
MILELPPDAPALVSHVRGVRIATPRPEIRARHLKKTAVRDLVRRFERDRTQYASVKAFAQAEQARLRQIGILVTARQLEAAIARGPSRLLSWERLRDYLRDGWHDAGDIRTALGWTGERWAHELTRLRRAGYPVEKRPTSRTQYRGWPFEYRLMPRP